MFVCVCVMHYSFKKYILTFLVPCTISKPNFLLTAFVILEITSTRAINVYIFLSLVITELTLIKSLSTSFFTEASLLVLVRALTLLPSGTKFADAYFLHSLKSSSLK